MGENFYVYILSNVRHTVMYTGVTNNLVRRVQQHALRGNSGFTKKYNVTKLLYYEHFTRADDAIKREKQIKGYGRKKKVALILEMNPGWVDLSREFGEDG